MKQYNNGPRKSMMYGGMSRRKPMMYGGKATTKKPRKKAYMGGMMSATQPQQNQMQNNMTSGQMNQMQTQMMQTPKLRMSKGGEANLKKERSKKRKEASDAYRKKQNELGRIMGPDSLSPGEQKLMGRSTNNKFGMLSVKAGIDNNPNPTQADRIAGARMRKKR